MISKDGSPRYQKMRQPGETSARGPSWPKKERREVVDRRNMRYTNDSTARNMRATKSQNPDEFIHKLQQRSGMKAKRTVSERFHWTVWYTLPVLTFECAQVLHSPRIVLETR